MKRSYKIFADEIIKGKSEIQAYMAAYPKAKKESARVKSYKLLQNVTIATYIKTENEKIAIPAQNKAIEALKDKIIEDRLTKERKEQILKDIAEGKTIQEVYKMVFDSNKNKDVPVLLGIEKPSIKDRITAIQVHNLMAGDNAPTKVASTTKDGEDVNTTPIINITTVSSIEILEQDL